MLLFYSFLKMYITQICFEKGYTHTHPPHIFKLVPSCYFFWVGWGGGLQFILCSTVSQDLYTIISDEDRVLTLCCPSIVQCDSCPAILQYNYLMWPLGQYRLYCESHSCLHLPRIIIICIKQKSNGPHIREVTYFQQIHTLCGLKV